MFGLTIYQKTLLMLDACNLSGLGHSFSKEIIPAIWEEVRQADGGTKQFNEHPLAVLWIMKMASLAYPECLCESCMEAFRQACEEVKKRAGEGGAAKRGNDEPEGPLRAGPALFLGRLPSVKVKPIPG